MPASGVQTLGQSWGPRGERRGGAAGMPWGATAGRRPWLGPCAPPHPDSGCSRIGPRLHLPRLPRVGADSLGDVHVLSQS